MKITKERKLITIINVFNVDPEKQQQLVNLLIQATESSVRHVPGFISATLHRSLDGAKVAMYAQWRSIEDYQAMRANPTALPFMQQALALAKFDPGMYVVIEIFEPDLRPGGRATDKLSGLMRGRKRSATRSVRRGDGSP